MSKKRLVVLLIIILIVITLSSFVFFKIYKKNMKKVVELDLNSEIVNNLYNYVMKLDTRDYLGEYKTVYQSKKVTEKDLNESLKMLTTFNNINLENESKDKEEKVIGEHIIDKYYYFDKSFVDNRYKKIFGNKASLCFQECINSNDSSIRLIDDRYIVEKRIIDNYDNNNYKFCEAKSQLIRAEKNNGYINIYDKYIFSCFENISKEKNKYLDGTFLYNTSDKNKLLSKVEGKVKIKDEDFKLANTFKHTFKKSIFGSYYWISTEIVE